MPPSDNRTGAARRSGGATSAASRPTTSARTSGSRARSCWTTWRSQPREVHRIRGEAGAEAAAAEYDGELEGASLDLVLLGIGPDGHTASLFPGQPTLEERERRAIPAEATLEPFVERVTLTLPVLCSAPEVLFLVTGEGKADAVERAFGRPPSAESPSSLIRSAAGRTRVIADAAAASGLH